jgi:hypothetical protein
MSFNRIIQVVKKDKFNNMEILDKHKMTFKRKLWMNIPLCTMISMRIIHLALKINDLKMEHAFQIGNLEGNKLFYVSLLNWRG